MDERDRRARSIHETISKILFEDWDPLGLTGIAPSDYSYVGGVYRLLASGASANEIAEHLAQIERGPMGYDERLLLERCMWRRSYASLTCASKARIDDCRLC